MMADEKSPESLLAQIAKRIRRLLYELIDRWTIKHHWLAISRARVWKGFNHGERGRKMLAIERLVREAYDLAILLATVILLTTYLKPTSTYYEAADHSRYAYHQRNCL